MDVPDTIDISVCGGITLPCLSTNMFGSGLYKPCCTAHCVAIITNGPIDLFLHLSSSTFFSSNFSFASSSNCPSYCSAAGSTNNCSVMASNCSETLEGSSSPPNSCKTVRIWCRTFSQFLTLGLMSVLTMGDIFLPPAPPPDKILMICTNFSCNSSINCGLLVAVRPVNPISFAIR